MAKTKTTYYCQNCGAQYSKWMGQCQTCKEWNTIVEEVISKKEQKKPAISTGKISKKIWSLEEIDTKEEYRISTNNSELDRVLGGGIVPGSVILLGGEPGIGKSTLMLQIALNLPFNTLYVSGEESPKQIRMRAERIGYKSPNMKLLFETNTQKIFHQLQQHQPDILVIDSIQTLHTDYVESSPGSVSQIRESASEIIQYAKSTGTPVFIIGHINKEGQIAGPKVLEHMVDTVLQFEGDRNHLFRILRASKNRFGATSEIGIFEMYNKGLREISNPSNILLSSHKQDLSGTAIAVATEGIRPILIEVQALVSSAVYGTPQRSTTGYDIKRLHMILAVLEKRMGFKLASKDVFLNITGGIKIDDPAIDLAVAAAILSSNNDLPVPSSWAFAGEVGLTGEVRPVTRIEQRISEAEKLGFEKIFISAHNKINPLDYRIQIIGIKEIRDLNEII
jgi:DNA repair protein RadA/Sms